MSYCSPAICLYKYYIFEGESHVQEEITTDGTKVAVFKVASSSVWNPHPDFDFNGGNERACGEDEERSDDGSRHSGNRVLLYVFLRQAGNRVPKRKGTGGSGVQNEAVSDDFCQFL